MCQWKNLQKDEMQNASNLLFLMLGGGWGGGGWRKSGEGVAIS